MIYLSLNLYLKVFFFPVLSKSMIPDFLNFFKLIVTEPMLIPNSFDISLEVNHFPLCLFKKSYTSCCPTFPPPFTIEIS